MCADRCGVPRDAVKRLDRLTRGLLVLRFTPLGTAAHARNASRAPGCGCGDVECDAPDACSGMSRSAPADARAVKLFYCQHVQPKRCTRWQPPPSPQGASSDHIDITPRALCATWRAPRCSAHARIMGAMSSARAALESSAEKCCREFIYPPPARVRRRAWRFARCACAAPRRPQGLPLESLRRASRGVLSRACAACSRRTAFAVGLQRLASCSRHQGLP